MLAIKETMNIILQKFEPLELNRLGIKLTEQIKNTMNQFRFNLKDIFKRKA